MMDGKEVAVAVLAGGLGSRLRPAVADRPKALAPVGGRPYLTYLLDLLARAGVGEVVLLTGYRAEQVRGALGDTYAGMRLVHAPEPAPLGTGGAVRRALPLLAAPTVLLLNGDSYCDIDLEAFLASHRWRAADLSLALARVADTSRFGAVQLAADGRVTRFEEKNAAGGAGWINAGVYLVARALLEEIPTEGPVSLERQMFPVWLARHACYGFRCEGRFLDIGTPESYARAEAFFRTQRRCLRVL
jgi:NDP-sugar pyrophosphorylase family protein